MLDPWPIGVAGCARMQVARMHDVCWVRSSQVAGLLG